MGAGNGHNGGYEGTRFPKAPTPEQIPAMPSTQDQISEKSRRVLLRIVQQMRSGASMEIHLVLGKGGVRDYQEQRTFTGGDLPEGSDADLDRILGG